MLFPRFRSRERDLRSDIDRLSSILQSVERAIGEARSETDGLANRLEDARSRAAFLYGDVIEGNSDQGERGSELIREAERTLVRGERRREELVDHMAFLVSIETELNDALEDLRTQESSGD